ncbi:alpha/beta fold hydrolase [Leifsonia sp. NPDC058230]|uniref:alpha/beta fold hydrolase n=1 Tax=Leifsonia sp. NPDC058230 TaxID=3346391 RepID=UPI0036D9B2FE
MADSTKPTIVLVHGAWADGSSWNAVTVALQAQGFTVLVPPNPLRNLPDDSAYIASFLAQRTSGPVVLAGHSYGGAVTTNAASSVANVKALVYVDAFIPDEGETVVSIVEGSTSAVAVDPATIFDIVGFPGAAEGDGDAYLKPEVVHASFAQDLPEADRWVIVASQRPTAFAANVTPSGPPAWKSIPSWAVLGTEDKAIPIDVQRRLAERAGSIVTEVKASHVSMVSQPSASIDAILAAVAAIS